MRIQLEVAPETLTAEVPWFVFQPLVENALKHGIDSLPSNGVLRIEAGIEGDQLRLVVADNGPGFPVGFIRARDLGVGLRNTEARLARLYGAAALLEINGSAPEAGARVSVRLPLRTTERCEISDASGPSAVRLREHEA